MDKMEELLMTLMHIPGEYIDRDFKMNPLTDDIREGSALEVGMVVLLEDNIFRPTLATPYEQHNAYDRARLDEGSRWCQIETLRHKKSLVTFIGVYADGTKRVRTYNQDYFWFVKV